MNSIVSWLIVAAVILYLLNPFDFPSPFDDLLVAILGAYFIYRRNRAQKTVRGGGEEWARSEYGSGETGRKGPVEAGAWQSKDPYEVLGVPSEVTDGELERVYRDLLKKYHPDRVQHLGDEFQEMAEERAKVITEAHAKILRERGK